MASQTVFERYELKYLLTQRQKEALLAAMEPHMRLDGYGRSTIRNIYYDTDSYRLIRRSIEKPIYKEKLRIRSYQQAAPDSSVYVELKKKYRHTVYKRRVVVPNRQAMRWMSGDKGCALQGQIPDEIAYFLDFYGVLRPVVCLFYDREAYYSLSGDGFRVTFDENILCRQDALSLEADVWGTPLLEEGTCLMEIKCSGGIPLWMTRALTGEGIRRASFSKYGTAYQQLIYPEIKEKRYV